MDKKKSILNVSVSIAFKIMTMVMGIAVRRCLIRACGNEVNGLNALYLSIIGFLAVAELGVGSAITFSMYRPIVAGENEKVSALYHLFRRWYLIIGGVILAAGLALTPFIHHFARDYTQLDVDLYSTFALMLVSVVLTYLFGAKTALINAYKNNYITTAITSGGLLLQYVLQIAALSVTGSFKAYLVCRSAAVLVQWGITELVARKKYDAILSTRARIDSETRIEVTKNIRAMFMHKIGALLVNTVDSVVISAFIGVAVLGRYSNYTTIQASMDGIIKLVFSSLISVVGHMYAQKSKNVARAYCEVFHMLNFMIGTVFYTGYYAVIDPVIAILFAEELVVERSISLVITLNGFVQFMRSGVLTFRDATGTFYNDRWKPLAEGLVNLTLSVLLVKQIGVVGVIVATVITNLLICHIVEPCVLYKNAFQASPRQHYVRNYGMILLFGIGLMVYNGAARTQGSFWRLLLVNGAISVGVSAMICLIATVANRRICRNMVMLFRRENDGTFNQRHRSGL